ncbi:MAG: peroxiredoxin-like family protein [Sporichthyaceae bacterium]
MAVLRMREHAPELDLPLVGGGRWRLGEQQPKRFTLMIFYRGLHCPKCHDQLNELDGKLAALDAVGVSSVVAISGDDEARATRTVQEWELSHVPVAFGLTMTQAREWGLFVSKGVKEPEPDEFNEPGIFLVRDDGTLYSAHVQSMPFARPHLDNLIRALGYINENDYPARGEA